MKLCITCQKIWIVLLYIVVFTLSAQVILITHVDVTHLHSFFNVGDLFKLLLECVLALLYAPLLPFQPYWSVGLTSIRTDLNYDLEMSVFWSLNWVYLFLFKLIWISLFNIPFKQLNKLMKKYRLFSVPFFYFSIIKH